MKKKQDKKSDWNRITNQLKKIQETSSCCNEIDQEGKKKIFKTRAMALAKEPEEKAGAHEFIDIVKFQLAYETYGIESKYVSEIYPLKDYTQLPGVPQFIAGIINVRGHIISIVDLKKFFNLPEKGLGQLNKVIIIHNEQMEFGILADIILGSSSIPIDTIQESPPTVTGIGGEYLKGVSDDRAVILDAEKILNDENMIIYQKEE